MPASTIAHDFENFRCRVIVVASFAAQLKEDGQTSRQSDEAAEARKIPCALDSVYALPVSRLIGGIFMPPVHVCEIGVGFVDRFLGALAFEDLGLQLFVGLTKLGGLLLHLVSKWSRASRSAVPASRRFSVNQKLRLAASTNCARQGRSVVWKLNPSTGEMKRLCDQERSGNGADGEGVPVESRFGSGFGSLCY